MRYAILLLSCLLPHIALTAQDGDTRKYQSLFWKIEGNGLANPSYLYGTMHVSNKIAYHLSDDFYLALKEVDQVALETHPDTWMDKMLDVDNARGYSPYGGGPSLYSAFLPNIPKEDDIKGILQQNSELVNGILYRNSQSRQNFEEETYLDMFIFQAGGKMGKPVHALEDIDEADRLVAKATSGGYRARKKDYVPWLKKLLQKKNIITLTEDAYRDKDLDLIDSLNLYYYSEEYNEYMLYRRNRNMVVALDSVFEKGSVFIGIGAAHLPGEQGVIEMLRDEGYTVTAITGELTDKGTRIKEGFENSFGEVRYANYETDDGHISMTLPGKFHEFGMRGRNVGVSMDITNGAYFLMFRTNTYNPLAEEKINLDDIEGMLYENIPGKITKKERVTVSGLPAISVHNHTKSGDHQRYLIVESPLEIIVFKLGGKKDYADDFGDNIFDSIRFNSSSAPTRRSPFYGDFSLLMPKWSSIPANNEISSAQVPLEIQGFDPADSSYYYATSQVYHDVGYLEDDDFELEYIMDVFYEKMDTSKHFMELETDTYATALSGGTLKGGQRIWMKCIKDGYRYYLLSCVGADSLRAMAYFNSFAKESYTNEGGNYELRQDTSLYYSVISPINVPEYRGYYRLSEEVDTIDAINKGVSYGTPAKERINVSFNKYHNYFQVDNVDTIWARIERDWAESYEVKELVRGSTEAGLPTLTFKVGKEGSSREIRNHYILNHGVLYVVEYDAPLGEQPSRFAKEFLGSFTVSDTLVGRSPFEDKADLFFANAYSVDSLSRAQALSAYDYVKFKKSDVPALMKMVRDFEFTEEELGIKVGLLEKLGRMEDPRVFPFLRELYTTSEYNSVIQLEVLNALAKSQQPRNALSILKLLEADIPLSSERAIANAFSPLRDSLEIGRFVFPSIMDYAYIPEYRSWIYSLSTELRDAGLLKKGVFRKRKKDLVNEMKIELKRRKSGELANASDYGHYAGGYSSLLNSYIIMLAPFHKDAEVAELFKKAATLKNDYTKALIQAQLAKNNFPVDEELIREMAEDPKTRSILYQRLRSYGQLDHFPKEFLGQRQLAESYLLSSSSYPKLDSIEFVKEVSISDKEDDYVVYFFKTMKEKSDYYDADTPGEWGLQHICYKLDKDKGELQTRSYDRSSFKEMDFEDADAIRKYEKRALDGIRYKKRKRIGRYMYR